MQGDIKRLHTKGEKLRESNQTTDAKFAAYEKATNKAAEVMSYRCDGLSIEEKGKLLFAGGHAWLNEAQDNAPQAKAVREFLLMPEVFPSIPQTPHFAMSNYWSTMR